MDRNALSLPILISLVVGNMIGTGIYVLPASLAQYGSISLLAWIYTSIGAIFFALTLTALNRRLPRTGGLYVFCRVAYGNMAGFIVGYLYWVANMVSIAGITIASIGYLGYIWPVFDSNSPQFSEYFVLGCELAVIWTFTLINTIGIHAAGVVQLILTVTKILPLLAISLLGLGYVHLDNLTPITLNSETNFTAIGSAAALTFWAFIGLETATIPAENTKGSSDIFKATFFGTLGTSIIYILSTFVLMGMIPASKLASNQFPFAEAGQIVFGAGSAAVIAIFAVISGLGALNATILVQGQIVFAAARDKLFPARFAKLSKHDVPIAGQLFSSTLVTILMIVTLEPTLLEQFNNIALLAGLFTLMAYLGSALAELKFLYQDFGFSHKLLWNKSTPVALIAITYCIWMISNFTNIFLLYGVGSIIVFAVIYFLVFKKHMLGTE